MVYIFVVIAVGLVPLTWGQPNMCTYYLPILVSLSMEVGTLTLGMITGGSLRPLAFTAYTAST